MLTPLYFAFDLVGRLYPPPLTHPDFYYGFIGLGIAWQVRFLVIGRDPARFRQMMIPAVLEKFIFVVRLGALNAQGRVRPGGQLAAAGPDLLLGVPFIISFLKVGADPRHAEGDYSQRPTDHILGHCEEVLVGP